MSDLILTPLHAWQGLSNFLANSEATLDAIIKRSQKDWARALDRPAALAVMHKLAQDNGPYGLQATVLNDSHLLVWTFGGPWYAPTEKWITEQFFLRLGRGSTDAAFDAIDLLKERTGASGVIMATSLAKNDEALGRLLARHGYMPMSSQHFKG